jgi:hypothetical protein
MGSTDEMPGKLPTHFLGHLPGRVSDQPPPFLVLHMTPRRLVPLPHGTLSRTKRFPRKRHDTRPVIEAHGALEGRSATTSAPRAAATS